MVTVASVAAADGRRGRGEGRVICCNPARTVPLPTRWRATRSGWACCYYPGCCIFLRILQSNSSWFPKDLKPWLFCDLFTRSWWKLDKQCWYFFKNRWCAMQLRDVVPLAARSMASPSPNVAVNPSRVIKLNVNCLEKTGRWWHMNKPLAVQHRRRYLVLEYMFQSPLIAASNVLYNVPWIPQYQNKIVRRVLCWLTRRTWFLPRFFRISAYFLRV